MTYEKLIETFAKRPFFETADLLTLSGESEQQVLPCLSRWVRQEKLVQLRRGKYMLPEPYQIRTPHPFYISNYLYSPSYVSLYTALEYYKLIPEHTPVIQAVTTRDTRNWQTPYGVFQYQSLKIDRFSGYKLIRLGNSSQQRALIANPEKALVDICLLNSGEWDLKRWSSLRLQNSEVLDLDILLNFSMKIPSGKLVRGVNALIQHLAEPR